MITKKVQVTFEVEVTVDESKLDEREMELFRQSFYDFSDLDEHMEHIAQMKVRNILEPFTEGYGELKDYGIVADVLCQDSEIIY